MSIRQPSRFVLSAPLQALCLAHGINPNAPYPNAAQERWAHQCTALADDTIILHPIYRILARLYHHHHCTFSQISALLTEHLLPSCSANSTLNSPFNPFGDPPGAAYLRNRCALSDPTLIKHHEHLAFYLHFAAAARQLHSQHALDAAAFLHVHRTLFECFYPWAGATRHQLGAAPLVSKGSQIQFEHSERIGQALDWAFAMGNDPKTVRQKPGTVLGALAWAHPFLDGNGRALLLVHTELCARAGFRITWQQCAPDTYLRTLTQELLHPDQGILDALLLPLCQSTDPTHFWLDVLG